VRQTIRKPGKAGEAEKHRAAQGPDAPRTLVPNQTSILGDLVGSVEDPAARRPTKMRGAGGSWRWPLAYVQHGARDPRFDLLRGLCVIAMVVAGLGGESWLVPASGGQGFFVSAAEGFVVIAGYILGFTASREPLGEAVRHLMTRVWRLYRLAVGITVLGTLLTALVPVQLWTPFPGSTAYDGRPDALIVAAMTLARTAYGAEYLALYAVLFLVAPLALLAFAEGRGWLVPLVSMGLYLAAQLYSEVLVLPFATGVSLVAWQLLFFGGLTIAYYREGITAFAARYRHLWWLYATLVSVLALVGLVLLQRGTLPAWLFDPQGVEIARLDLTPRHLVCVAIYLQAFALLVTWLWVPLRAILGWFVLSLGRNALWVYLLFLPLAALFHTVPSFAAFDRTGLIVAQLLALSILWGMVKLRDWLNGSAYRGALPTARGWRGLARR
jgi:hypothetical protein